MKSLLQALGVSAAIVSAGCATSYHSTGFTGGFSDTQLAPDVFRIHFTGNAYTSSERTQDFCLLRAADLTLQRGFTHFIVMNETGETVYSAHEDRLYAKPKNNVLIRCFAAKPDRGTAFDAAFLQQSLKHKYKITK